eukprot:5311564-Amphidinium_carterae.1
MHNSLVAFSFTVSASLSRAKRRDVTDHRDRLLEEFRSERARQQSETELRTEQARALGVSSEEVSSLKRMLSRMNTEVARAHQAESVKSSQLACEEAVVARMSRDLQERVGLE